MINKEFSLKNNALLILFLAKLMIVPNTNAQDFQLAGISSAFYPTSNVKVGAQNVEISFLEFEAFVNVPYKFKNNQTLMINGYKYSWVESTADDLPIYNSGVKKERLQAIYYQLILVHKLSEIWKTVLSLNPAVASDFEEKLGRDDFLFLGFGMVSKQINKNFNIGGGVAYTMLLGGPNVIPILPMSYSKNQHHLNAVLPIRAKYYYQLGKNQRLKIGCQLMINGGQYNITGSAVTQDYAEQMDKIKYSRTNFGGIVNYKLNQIIRLEIFGGYSLRRQYIFADMNENKYELDLNETPFIQFGLVMAPPLKNKD